MLSSALRAFIIVNPAFELHWLNTEENNTSVENSKVSSPRAFSKICAFGALRNMCSTSVYFINQRVKTSLERMLRGSREMSNKCSVSERCQMYGLHSRLK